MMYRMLTALLIGATMAAPALAQDRGPDDDRRGRIDGRFDGGRPDRPDRDRFDGPRDRAPDRIPDRDPDRRPDPRNTDRNRWQGDRDARRDGRFDDRVDGRFDDRDDRRGGNDRGRWQGGRFANNYGDQRWTGNTGTWSRDWRGDRRYDWQSYRRGHDDAFRAPRYYGPRGLDYGYRRWSPGYRIAPAHYGQGYWITRPDRYRLPPAYGGYRWVRYYDDVALVDIRSGLIADILYSFFL